jgi:hypothetical protein
MLFMKTYEFIHLEIVQERFAKESDKTTRDFLMFCALKLIRVANGNPDFNATSMQCFVEAIISVAEDRDIAIGILEGRGNEYAMFPTDL